MQQSCSEVGGEGPTWLMWWHVKPRVLRAVISVMVPVRPNPAPMTLMSFVIVARCAIRFYCLLRSAVLRGNSLAKAQNPVRFCGIRVVRLRPRRVMARSDDTRLVTALIHIQMQ